MKLPARLAVELNSLYPRWPCYVHDGVGTANGGFWRGFKSHAALFAWLARPRVRFLQPHSHRATTMTQTQLVPVFAVVYSRDLAQYVVERGEMRVVPTRDSLNTADPECAARAQAMCVALNRVYAVTEKRA